MKGSQLTVLGSGTCVSGMGWKKEERWPPAYLLSGIGPELILLEASEGVRYRIQQAGEEYTKVSDILISHLHPDHFDLVSFVQSAAIKKHWSKGKFGRDKIRVFGPKGIEKAFWNIWKIKVPEHPKKIYGLLELDFIEFGGGERLDFYDGKLLAFKVFHAFGKVRALAFRLETPWGIFVYSGDSGSCKSLEKAAFEADVFLCEASSDIGEDKSTTSGHLNPYQAGELAKKAGVKKLYLTHYSGRDSASEIIKSCKKAGFKGEISVVKDGDCFFSFLQ